MKSEKCKCQTVCVLTSLSLLFNSASDASEAMSICVPVDKMCDDLRQHHEMKVT